MGVLGSSISLTGGSHAWAKGQMAEGRQARQAAGPRSIASASEAGTGRGRPRVMGWVLPFQVEQCPWVLNRSEGAQQGRPSRGIDPHITRSARGLQWPPRTEPAPSTGRVRRGLCSTDRQARVPGSGRGLDAGGRKGPPSPSFEGAPRPGIQGFRAAGSPFTPALCGLLAASTRAPSQASSGPLRLVPTALAT